MRVLFYTVNGNGLGHLMRMVTIAKRLRRLRPDDRILFVTSCEQPGILWQEGFTSVKVPSRQSFEMLRMPPSIGKGMIEGLVGAAIESFRPDALVVDSMPFGTVAELRPHLDRIAAKVFVSNLFLIRSFDRYRDAVHHYDLLVLPFGQAEVGRHGALREVTTPICFAGPIADIDPDRLQDRAAARRTLGIPATGPAVLVMLGGGGNPDAIEHLRLIGQAAAAFPTVRFVVLSPPLGRFRLVGADRSNVMFVNRLPIAPHLKAFDAAISGVGMNASAELTIAGVPMVWIPLGVPSTDQELNARRYVRHGIGVRPELTRDGIRGAIEAVLDPANATAMRARMRRMTDGRGAETAARAIAERIAAAAPAARAAATGDRVPGKEATA